MPLKKSKGNMYPWITHTHSHLGGKCVHNCSYCYVQASAKINNNDRYTGPLKLIEKEFNTNYGQDKSIFIEHCNDLFAEDVPDEWINRILEHCRKWPNNEYILQSKNPGRMAEYLEWMPTRRLLGTTIETSNQNILNSISKTPPAETRYNNMKHLKLWEERVFITIEPILQGDMELLAKWIIDIKPEFVNIGADSKGTNLPEPTTEEIKLLISLLQENKIEIREKHNLERLLS